MDTLTKNPRGNAFFTHEQSRKSWTDSKQILPKDSIGGLIIQIGSVIREGGVRLLASSYAYQLEN